jgi:hypothetical protein
VSPCEQSICLNLGHIPEVSTLELLIYEDRPRYSWALKGILLLPLAILLVEAIVLAPMGFGPAYAVLLGSLAFLLVVFWCVLPRRYAVMDDRLRIELGWPFGFSLPYRNLAGIRRDSGGWRITVNWVTTLETARLLCIVPKAGMNIMISPSQRDQFAVRLEKALDAWRRRPEMH